MGAFEESAATTVGSRLVTMLQQSIMPVERPFAELGHQLGVSEMTVLQEVYKLEAQGAIRRFGAVFEGRRLGYASTLCAVAVPEGELEQAAAIVVPLTGVTHCYSRSNKLNLWFTLSAEADRLGESFARLSELFSPYRLYSMPALRTFKIAAVFGGARGNRRVIPTAAVAAGTFSERERAVVRCLQGELPLVAEPFHSVAKEVGIEVGELLRVCQEWLACGVIRRMGVILHHRQAGMSANAMCAWLVEAAQVSRAGEIAAASPLVSHCYERAAFDIFPYNLYAMIHAPTREAVEAALRGITEEAGLTPGVALWTGREFKKTSPAYFITE